MLVEQRHRVGSAPGQPLALLPAASTASKAGCSTKGSGSSGESELVHELQLQVQQRDDEIAQLVAMLRSQPGPKSGTPTVLSALPGLQSASAAPSWRTGETPSASAAEHQLGEGAAAGSSPAEEGKPMHGNGPASSSLRSTSVGSSDVGRQQDNGPLPDRQQAFELFRKSYCHNEVRPAACCAQSRVQRKSPPAPATAAK